MQFRNPENGYIETKTLPALWALLFGGLYLLINGLWAPFLCWLILSMLAYAALGPAGTMFVLLMSVVLAFLAANLIRASYLRRGWVDVDTEDGISGTRKCPMCAEVVKREAVICRFCKSELGEVAEKAVETQAEQGSAYDALMMDRFAIAMSDGRYYRDGKAYANLNDAVAGRNVLVTAP